MGLRLSCDCASGPFMDGRPDETIVMTNEDHDWKIEVKWFLPVLF